MDKIVSQIFSVTATKVPGFLGRWTIPQHMLNTFGFPLNDHGYSYVFQAYFVFEQLFVYIPLRRQLKDY